MRNVIPTVAQSVPSAEDSLEPKQDLEEQVNLERMTPDTNWMRGCQHYSMQHRHDRWSGSVKTPQIQQCPAEQRQKGSVTCTHSQSGVMGLLKVSSFRELKMRLFVILNLSTDKLLILALRKNPIQVALLLKFILMCQFCALFILIFFP